MSSSRFLLALELMVPLPWTDQDYPPSERFRVCRKLRVGMPPLDDPKEMSEDDWVKHIASEIRRDIAHEGSIEGMIRGLIEKKRAFDGKIHVRWEQDCKDHHSGYVGEDVRVTCWPHPEGHWAWEVWGEDPDEPVRIGRADDYDAACKKAEETLAEYERGKE